MLQRKPENRLGLNGPSEVKNHSWLRDINWHKLLEKSIRAPFIPPKEDNFDTRHLMNGWNEESLDSMGMS